MPLPAIMRLVDFKSLKEIFIVLLGKLILLSAGETVSALWRSKREPDLPMAGQRISSIGEKEIKFDEPLFIFYPVSREESGGPTTFLM